MLQWATKVMPTSEALCVWLCYVSKVYRSKVGCDLQSEQLAASDFGASASEWKKVSYIAHIKNWNRFFTLRFLSKCTWAFFLPAGLIDWRSWSCGENQNIYFIWIFHYCNTDWASITLKCSPPAFFSCFSKLVPQQEGSHCFSYLLKNGRFSSTVTFFLEVSEHWHENICCFKIPFPLSMSGVETLMPTLT